MYKALSNNVLVARFIQWLNIQLKPLYAISIATYNIKVNKGNKFDMVGKVCNSVDRALLIVFHHE